MSDLDKDNIALESSDLSQPENMETTVENEHGENKQEPRSDLIAIGDSFNAIESSDTQSFEILRAIAATNEVSTPWSELRIMLNHLIAKQSQIMDPKILDHNIRNEVDKITSNISHVLGSLQDCPFTIQRACELIVNPSQHYKTYIKYLRAFEKIITVTSPWKAFVNQHKGDDTNENSTNQTKASFIFDNVQIETESLHCEDEHMESEESLKINGTHTDTTEPHEDETKEETTESPKTATEQTEEYQGTAESIEETVN